MIRVILPFHLRNLAHVGSEVTLVVEDPVTQRSVLDALEARYPMLRGAIRDHDTQERRASAEEAWRQRIARRIEELDSGKVKPILWAEARRQISAILNGR
jgi:hypothetical protein